MLHRTEKGIASHLGSKQTHTRHQAQPEGTGLLLPCKHLTDNKK